MKIMTLNAHSHGVDLPANVSQKNIADLADFILKQQIDVIALQEVCQTQSADIVKLEEIHRFITLSGEEGIHDLAVGRKEENHDFAAAGRKTAIRQDNYVWQLIQRLEQNGCHYGWTWDGIKTGYGIFDEGLAIISRLPIENVESYYLSNSHDYQNWKTRKAIAADIRVGAQKVCFVCTHLGWWGDEEEPFASQMDLLQKELSGKKGNIYLMGDFNSPADERNTGYDYVKSYGWLDIWQLAGNDGHEMTVPGKIDGWSEEAEKGLCIDYIWSNVPVDVASSRIVFSGQKEPVISDHFGILAEIYSREQ